MDKFTAEAFKARTSLNCHALSFEDIANGSLTTLLVEKATGLQGQASTDHPQPEDEEARKIVEMTICSFALHLIESPSELFALLWQLRLVCWSVRGINISNMKCSLRTRWLIVLAPHKKPEVRLWFL